jgi:hypothetical protein
MEIKNHFYVYNKEAEKIAKMEEKGISAAEVTKLRAALAKQKRKNDLPVKTLFRDSERKQLALVDLLTFDDATDHLVRELTANNRTKC